MGVKADTVSVLIREGECDRYPWRQYLVVTDQRVVVVHMIPALARGCWNFGRVDIQGPDSWPDMTRDAIVAWKATHDASCRTFDNPEDSGFRQRLLAKAGLAADAETP